MKINNLHILYILPVFPVLSETFIIREINALIEKGINIDIYALRKENSNHKISKNIRIYYTNYTNPISKLLRILYVIVLNPIIYINCLINCLNQFNNYPIIKILKDIRHLHIGIFISSYIDKKKYNSMYSHWGTANTISASINRFTNLSHSICFHANELYTQNKISSWTFENASYIVVNNKYNIHYFNLVTNYDYSDRVRLIYNCPPEISKQYSPRESITDSINLLCIGRLVYFKDHPTIINTCELLKDNNIDFKLTIAGSGESKDQIKRLINRKKLCDYITLVGRYEPDEVWDLFSKNDILIHASGIGPAGSRDGLPNVIIESMFAGMPVISSYISSIPELIKHGETGLLVPEKSPKELCKCILELYQNKKLYQRISTECLKHIRKKIDTDKTSNSLIDIMH